MAFEEMLKNTNAANVILVIVLLLGLRLAFRLFYNVFLHPLSKFPGPKLAGASQLYLQFYTFKGQKHTIVERLHNQYGEVVRIAPNELSFITETAWKDIYMYRGKDRSQMVKGDGRGPRAPPYQIISAPDDVHARQRKILSASFSDRATREQEPLLMNYVNQLVSILRDHAEKKQPIDIVKYMEFTTSDIISDYCFAESYGQLKSHEQEPAIKAIHKFIPLEAKLSALYFTLRMVFILHILGITQMKVLARAQEQVKNRLEAAGDQKDMMKRVISHISEDGDGMSMDELGHNAMVLMLAGSETTATALAGSMFYLLKNPVALEKLTKELRGCAVSADDLTIAKLAQLPYLNAVIDETLRLYSPVPVALTRVVPPEGAAISGHWVPGNTTVGIPHRAAFRSSRNFADPNSFIPERWLPGKEKEFENDRHLVFQPFSAGPRNCLGKSLAEAEMRLVLAHLFYNFDFAIAHKEARWDDQQAFVLYQKQSLMLHVESRS